MSFKHFAALTAALFGAQLHAQAPAFQTPGMPKTRPRGLEETQTTRFSQEFNPAFSFIVDAIADYRDFNGATEDGFDVELRTFELGAQAWVDPNAFAYFIGATEGEELAIEEAAIHYVGLENNATVRAGRFFIDFGKQMQAHVHELRTVERPAALRALLGEEVKGDGVQYDQWVPVGDETALRWSAGAFRNLLPEENAFFDDPEASVEDRKKADDLNFTARVTAFTEVSESCNAQVGVSGRWVPDYSVEFGATGDMIMELSSAVYGMDLTCDWRDESGQEVFTIGGEFLTETGDGGAVNPTPGTTLAVDETLSGYYGFADYAWNTRESAGVQYSAVELADAVQSRIGEVEAYYTRNLSEYHRLRFGVAVQSRENDEDFVRAVIQYTGVVGAHGHGVNW